MDAFILTRFNCKQREVERGRPKDRMKERQFDEGYLTRRIKIMQELTSRSVKAQTVKPDGWLVFVQEGTPAHYIQAISAMGGQVVTVADSETDVVAAGRSLPAGATTINLDSDDALARDFVHRVTRIPKPGRYVFLRGARLRLDPPFYWTTRSETNPFVIDVGGNVFRFNHGHAIRSVIDVHRVMWAQTIHTDCIDNGVRLDRPRRSRHEPHILNLFR